MIVAIYSGVIPSTVFIENLIKGLAEKGCRIVLFGVRKQKIAYGKDIKQYIVPQNRIGLLFYVLIQMIKLAGVRTNNLKLLAKHLKNTGNLLNIRLWAKYLPVVNNRPDIFHIQWAKSIGEWIFLKTYFGVKIVVSFRGAHINYSPIVDSKLAMTYHKLLKEVDYIHAVSKAILRNGLRFGADISKSTIIYPSVSSYLLERPLCQKEIGKTLNILSVGRNHWKKGYRVALDCFSILKTKNIDFHYTIVGVVASEELIYQIEALGISENITLIGALPHDEVLNLYSKADIFLLPSFEEGVANVALEAMALGTPVISTDCGGMTEVIKHNINGWIVPIRNPLIMAMQIAAFLNYTPAQIQSIKNNARESIRTNHLLEQQIDSMLNVYKSII